MGVAPLVLLAVLPAVQRFSAPTASLAVPAAALLAVIAVCAPNEYTMFAPTMINTLAVHACAPA